MPFDKTPLVVKEVDFRRWSIQTALIYRGKTDTWKVPRGFVTDFASVPRFAVWLVPVTGRYTKASILHDWFCCYGIQAGLITARDTDGVFRRIMREDGVPFVLRWLVWTGVRWGAIFNRSGTRRPGWWRDAPVVLFWTVLFAPFVLPSMVAVGLGLFLWLVLEGLAWIIGRGVSRWSSTHGRSGSTRPARL